MPLADRAGGQCVEVARKGQVIAAGWPEIAHAEDQGKLGYVRTYKADYEVYEAQAMDPRNLRGELHVGVK